MTFWVCVVDAGSFNNLGWALISSDDRTIECDSFEQLVAKLPALIRNDGLALGIEAPLYLPRTHEMRLFTRARAIDGRHPWSAGAGATVTTIGLALLVNLLDRLREAASDAEVTLAPTERPRPKLLHLFEAFVAGGAKARQIEAPASLHHQDAMTAARAYLTLDRPTTAIDEEPPPFNLAAAALLATGWSSDVKLLSMPCLVVKPTGLLS